MPKTGHKSIKTIDGNRYKTYDSRLELGEIQVAPRLLILLEVEPDGRPGRARSAEAEDDAGAVREHDPETQNVAYSPVSELKA